MKKYYIAIDIGGTNTKIAFLNNNLEIIEKTSFLTSLCKKPSDLFTATASIIRRMLSKRSLSAKEIFGIGVGVAGQVDAKRGTIYNLTNIPGWRGVNIKKKLREKTGMPVFVDNDANVMALGELHKGAGRGCKNLVCITLGTGVGGGIIINGSLYRGHNYVAGEIGHIPINETGPKCNCGGAACIEAYVGNRYIVKELKKRIRKNKKALISQMVKKGILNLTPEALFKAARLGDDLSINFWKELGSHIGVMLTGVINLLNPDKIVIGGGVAEAGRFLFRPIRDTVKRRAMSMQRRHVKIVKAELKQDAGLIGAATLVTLEDR